MGSFERALMGNSKNSYTARIIMADDALGGLIGGVIDRVFFD